MWKNPFTKLYIFFIVYVWFKSFSGAVLPTHYLQQGLSLPIMMGGLVSLFFGQIVVLLTFKKLSARKSYFLALLTSILFLLLVIKINSSWQYYLASALAGASMYFYFVFYNIAYFENTPKEKTGRNSALMFSIPTIIGIFAPLLAGVLAQVSMNLIWVFSFVFFFPVLFSLFYQKDFTISYTIKASLLEIKATRTLLFIEGIWEALMFGVIPIYTLYFIKTPLGYGTYLAYLSIIGVLANLLLGKMTDKLQKRVIFLYPITIIMAIITFLFAFVQDNLSWWLILTAAIQLFTPLFWNITTAMVVDTHSNLRIAIPGRELVLAVGRFLGVFLVLLSFYWEKSPFWIYFVLGGVLLLFPVVLYWNTKSKRYQYL
ncbi:hypothetical protein KJ953_00705 [Patescibacteria group bacterium]|nr:hypothetical protein [Patescibacteria group bacterium]MBU1256285.1 hypothetical protein [Patescibacteria group bacterium]MBU1457524.1 hypothetical protein [Patescibacteria group bacterium]